LVAVVVVGEEGMGAESFNSDAKHENVRQMRFGEKGERSRKPGWVHRHVLTFDKIEEVIGIREESLSSHCTFLTHIKMLDSYGGRQ
jgi:hypothetical protein